MSYRTPSFVHLLRRARRLLGTALAAALTLLLVPLGQPAAHAVTAVSPGAAPFGPANTVIPNWYADAAGVRLQPCAAGLPLCPFAPADFAPSGGEAFYYRATSTLSTAPPPGIPAVKSVFVAGLEAAFVPAPLSIFERMRIRVQVPQTGTYTVTYPYGVKTYNVGVLGAAAEINDTVDTGCLGACTTAAQFALAAPGGQGLNSVEPFLQLAPGVVPTAGFLSTGVANPVVGSPLGTNFFRVEGSGINPGTDPTAACPAPLTGPGTPGSGIQMCRVVCFVLGRVITDSGETTPAITVGIVRTYLRGNWPSASAITAGRRAQFMWPSSHRSPARMLNRGAGVCRCRAGGDRRPAHRSRGES